MAELPAECREKEGVTVHCCKAVSSETEIFKWDPKLRMNWIRDLKKRKWALLACSIIYLLPCLTTKPLESRIPEVFSDSFNPFVIFLTYVLTLWVTHWDLRACLILKHQFCCLDKAREIVYLYSRCFTLWLDFNVFFSSREEIVLFIHMVSCMPTCSWQCCDNYMHMVI